jgi:hypothetical protein
MKNKFIINAAIIILIALYLVPVWRFKFFPSSDGPSHVYNTQVLKCCVDSKSSYHEYFNLNLRPYPNWTSSLIMLAFQYVASPLWAEKFFLTFYIVFFVFSFKYLLKASGNRTELYLLFSFLYLYNFLLLMGFYNYSLGVPLLLLTTGFFWKNKESLDWKRTGLLSLFLVILYFSHPVPYIAAIIILLLISLLYYKKRWKEIYKVLICLAPSFALCLYYFCAFRIFARQKAPSSFQNLSEVITDMITLKFLISVDTQRQPILAAACGILIMLLAIITIKKKITISNNRLSYEFNQKDYFFLIFLVTFILSIMTPDAIADHGSFIFQRVLLIASLLVIPWLTEELGRILKSFVTVFLICLVLANLFIIYHAFSMINTELAEFACCKPEVGHHNTLIPLIFKRNSQSAINQVFVHAASYYCLNNFNINLANYEADKDYFPIKFRKELQRPDVYNVFDDRNSLDFSSLAKYVKYIVVYGGNKNIMDKVKKHYFMICHKGKIRIFHSKFLKRKKRPKLPPS